MVSLRKFVPRKPKLNKTFGSFNVKVKSKSGLRSLVKGDSKLRKAVSAVFSKKGIVAVTGATVIGVGVTKMNDYIEANSGCFLRSGGGETCKVQALSCCQKNPVEGLEFCPDHSAASFDKACGGFDEDEEGSCCRLCDCETYACAPGQKMECKRPTVGEALSYFAQGASSSVWSWLKTLVPWWVVVAIAVVCGLIGLSFVGRLLPR